MQTEGWWERKNATYQRKGTQSKINTEKIGQPEKNTILQRLFLAEAMTESGRVKHAIEHKYFCFNLLVNQMIILRQVDSETRNF